MISLAIVILCVLFTHVKSFAPRLMSSTRIKNGIKLNDIPSDLGVFLYDSQLILSRAVEDNLNHPSIVSFALLFVAGLTTALSPCALSLVPITVASLSTTSPTNSSSELELKSAVMYTLGLASVLSILGLSAAFLGSVVSDRGGLVNDLPSLAAAVLSVTMGLNLLNIISIQFPSFDFGGKLKSDSFPKEIRALLLGASSALVASPCSSPVLTSLLAIVASSGNPSLGLVFLFAYSTGYAAPIVFAGKLSSVLTKVSSNFDVANAVVASLLITYGTYSSLDILSRVKL